MLKNYSISVSRFFSKFNYINKFFPLFYKRVRFFFFFYVLDFFYEICNLKKGTLLYLGVNQGDDLTRIFYKFKKCICVEASPKLCTMLKKKFKRKISWLAGQGVGCKFYNYIIHEIDNKYCYLNVYKNDYSNASIDLKAYEKPKFKVKVKTIRLDNLLKKLKISNIEYYYSDLEGLDYIALKTLKDFIKNGKIEYIQHECIVNGKSNPLVKFNNYEYLFTRLLKKKYKKVSSGFGKLYPGYYEKNNYVWQDVLWKKK